MPRMISYDSRSQAQKKPSHGITCNSDDETQDFPNDDVDFVAYLLQAVSKTTGLKMGSPMKPEDSIYLASWALLVDIVKTLSVC